MSQQRATSEPLYALVARDLRRKIIGGTWRPGDRIPSEHELCNDYHVSRITVRRGIDTLVRERLLERCRPVGTFVREARPDDGHLTLVEGLTGEVREEGESTVTLWADVSCEKADTALARALGVTEGTELLRLRRTRGSGARPFVHFETILVGCDELPLDSANYYGSLYDLLAAHGLFTDRIREQVEAVHAPEDVREALGIAKSEPVLRRTRLATQSAGPFRELTVCHYIGSEYRYCVDSAHVSAAAGQASRRGGGAGNRHAAGIESP